MRRKPPKGEAAHQRWDGTHMADRLIQLIYVSTAPTSLSETDVADIVQTSRENNSREGLTGLLVYNGLNFMQALEGPKGALTDRFRAISADPRHNGVVTVVWKELVEREFPDWSMGYERLNPDEPERHRLLLVHERMREIL